jgi:drug/metabolite transporter (DMT)-like permease
MLFWGLTFVWFKIANNYYNPLTIIFLRLVVSSALLWAFIRIAGKYEPLEKGDRKWFLLLALAQPFFYFLGESFGLSKVSSTISSAIIATIPLFSPLAAWLFSRERASVYALAGIAVSFTGIILMLVNRDLSLNAAPEGVLLLFMAVFAAVFYSLIVKRLSGKYSSLSIISRQNLIGSFYFLPLFLIFDFRDFMSVRPDFELISAMLQLAVFGSCLAYLFFITSIARLGMVKANIFTNLIPAFTAVSAYILLGETLNFQKVSGIALVVAGILVSQYRELNQLLNRRRYKIPTIKPQI